MHTPSAPSPYFPADRSFVSPETHDAFAAVMDRLDVVIDMETRALKAHDHRNLAEAARQKRQGLLELNRIMRTLASAIPSGDILARLAGFRDKLSKNQAALGVELEAAKAVTDIIMRAMREAESDGTYSRGHARAAGYDFA